MTRNSAKETLDRFIALSEQLGEKEETDEEYSNLADQFNAILADLLLHLDIFSAEQRQFIEDKATEGIQSKESRELYARFYNAHRQLDCFIRGTESADDDYTVAGNNFNSLLKEALDNLPSFTPAQRRFIEESKRKTFLPQHRLARCRARSRSQSRSRSPSVSH